MMGAVNVLTPSCSHFTSVSLLVYYDLNYWTRSRKQHILYLTKLAGNHHHGLSS